jgi:hypothetical protein
MSSAASLKDFDLLSDTEKAEAMALLKRYETLEKQESAQKDFISFVKTQWPDFIEGRHHRIIADKFNQIADGKLKRLIVCLPPRHSKSEFASTFFRLTPLSWRFASVAGCETSLTPRIIRRSSPT